MGLLVSEELANEVLTTFGNQEAYVAVGVLSEPTSNLGNTGVDRLLGLPRAVARLAKLLNVGGFVLAEDRSFRLLITLKPADRVVDV